MGSANLKAVINKVTRSTPNDLFAINSCIRFRHRYIIPPKTKKGALTTIFTLFTGFTTNSGREKYVMAIIQNIIDITKTSKALFLLSNKKVKNGKSI